MREEFKEKLLLVSIVIIGSLSIFVMCLRAEQIDEKKELPVATQSNSVNF